MDPWTLRDRINEGLEHTSARVSAAQFTRVGNIAITPMVPCTAAEMLCHAAIIGRRVAHGQPIESLAMELDDPWPSVVVRLMQLPGGRDVWEVEQALCEELGKWNPRLRWGVREVRVMRRLSEAIRGGRSAVQIAFTTAEGSEQVMREGICAFGERCRASGYRAR